MAENKKRKWVVKALAAFVVILALLTFFSNTIMNATIPKVMATYPNRGNLSYTNSASAQVVADNQQNVKAIEGRTVGEVLRTNYDYVNEGDTIVTLASEENNETLEQLRASLTQALREQEYANRQPNSGFDSEPYLNTIADCDEQVRVAEQTLSQAQNKDAIVAQAQQVINDNQALQVSCSAQVEAASSTLESINAEISELNSQLQTIESQINVFVALGTPTPSPTPAPGQEPEPTPVLPGEGEGGAGTTVPEPTAAPTPVDRTRIDELWAQKTDIELQISQLQAQISEAQARLDEASSRLADVQTVVEDAQAVIEEAEMLPTVTAAQNALNAARTAASAARRTYNEALVQAGISQDQAEDAANDMAQNIENLQNQIAELEEKLNVNELVAPCDGYVFNLAVSAGDVMMDKNAVVFTIIPDVRECSASFNFPTSVAQNFYVGMELETNSYWISECRIVNIKPDPENPRESRIVKCALTGDSWPGETITVTADRSNANYDHIVPSSAVNEDNTGTFIYVLEQSSTPLGEKYIVRRVDITVDATDGALTAISGNGIDNVMIITRSEEPLHNGDRVRLEDYSDTNS